MKIAAYSLAPACGLRRPTGHGADAGRHAGPPARAPSQHISGNWREAA